MRLIAERAICTALELPIRSVGWNSEMGRLHFESNRLVLKLKVEIVERIYVPK